MTDKNTEKAFGLYNRLKQEAGISGKVTPQNISKIREFISKIRLENSLAEIAEKYMVSSNTRDKVFNLLTKPSPFQKRFLFGLFKSVVAGKPITVASIEKKMGVSIGSVCPSTRILEDMGLIERKKRGIIRYDEDVFRDYYPEIESWKEIKIIGDSKKKETSRAARNERIEQGEEIIRDELKDIGTSPERASKPTLKKIIEKIRRYDFKRRGWTIPKNTAYQTRQRLLERLEQGKLFSD